MVVTAAFIHARGVREHLNEGFRLRRTVTSVRDEESHHVLQRAV